MLNYSDVNIVTFEILKVNYKTVTNGYNLVTKLSKYYKTVTKASLWADLLQFDKKYDTVIFASALEILGQKLYII